MRKYLFIVLFGIVLLGSIIIGSVVFLYNKSVKEEKNPNIILAEEIETNIVDTSSSDVIVSPNAKVIKTENFKKCGHTSTISEMVPREIVNLNKQKVEEYYSEWNMESFDVNEIKLSRKSSGICSEHYVLRETDGYLSISCKNDIGEYIFKGLTDISVQYLPEEDLAKIQNGIEIVGKENLNKFLEDFE